MKRVSKNPTIKSIQNILINLQDKFPHSAFSANCTSWAYSSSNREIFYQLYILPGLDGTKCSVHKFYSWAKLLTFYEDLMSREELGNE